MPQLHLDIADGTQPKHFPRFCLFRWEKVTQSAGKHRITYLETTTPNMFSLFCVQRRVFKTRLQETLELQDAVGKPHFQTTKLQVVANRRKGTTREDRNTHTIGLFDFPVHLTVSMNPEGLSPSPTQVTLT